MGRVVIGSNKVNGSTAPLAAPLAYAAADPGDAATRNDNAALAQGLSAEGAIQLGSNRRFDAPAGTYYVTGIHLRGGAVLNFTGPATLYVAGSIELGGHAAIRTAQRTDLKIIVLGDATVVDFDGGASFTPTSTPPRAAWRCTAAATCTGRSSRAASTSAATRASTTTSAAAAA